MAPRVADKKPVGLRELDEVYPAVTPLQVPIENALLAIRARERALGTVLLKRQFALSGCVRHVLNGEALVVVPRFSHALKVAPRATWQKMLTG